MSPEPRLREFLEEAAGLATSEKSLRRLYRQIGKLHLAKKEPEKAAEP